METKTRIGVVIGRLQSPYLSEGHNHLIKYVIERNDKLIIFLGTSQAKLTTTNPLDYETRKKMILDMYPDAIVSWIPDCSTDKEWSNTVDHLLQSIIKRFPNPDVELYGSRDSFIKYYSGVHRTQEIESPIAHVAASLIRTAVSKFPIDTVDFRKGVIYAAYNKYPIAYPVMDAAITRSDGKLVLLCTKSKYEKLQFIGGFFDVTKDKCLEDTVIREVDEECGIKITTPKYIKSILIDDWRYRGVKIQYYHHSIMQNTCQVLQCL